MKVRASVCAGVGEPWTLDEIDVDPPAAHEVVVQMAFAGMCHSDEHLRQGDLTPSAHVLELFGLSSLFPVVGGHEGAGIVVEVGPEVSDVSVGDHVAVAFIPACGTCFWCASGRQNLCDLGITTLCGPMISDGTWRYRLDGQPLNRMCQLGTFAEIVVCHEASLVKIDPSADLRAAALISCGIATGFGAAVNRGQVRPGEVVVVVGCGGVGSGAIQGARLAGARHIVAVDPLPFKLEKALEIGATHRAKSMEEATLLVAELSHGRMADVVILTPGTMTGDLLLPACSAASKDGRIVVTALAPMNQVDVHLNLFNLAMWNQAILGTVFGSVSPRVQTPRLLALHAQGLLTVDELISREYDLASVQDGYDDLHAGRNIRGVIRLG